MRKDKLRTRKLITDAAYRGFAQKGLEAVNFEVLAQAADVSRATLYNHFRNRDQLILDLARPILETGISLFSDDTIDNLEAIGRRLFDLWQKHGDGLSFVHCPETGKLNELAELHQRFMDVFNAAFERAHTAEPFPLGAHTSMIISFTVFIPILSLPGRGIQNIGVDEFVRMLDGLLYWRSHE